MTNYKVTAKLIAKEVLAILTMDSVLIQSVDRQLDHEKIFESHETSGTVKVKRRPRYVEQDGAVAVIQDMEYGSVDVTLDQRKHVAVAAGMQEQYTDFNDFAESEIRPAIEPLISGIEARIAEAYKDIYNFVGTAGTAIDGDTLRAAKALFNKTGVPMVGRKAFLETGAMNALAKTLATTFTQSIAKTAIERAKVGMYAGFDMIESDFQKIHTCGLQGGTPLVNGASQVSAYSAVLSDMKQNLVLDAASLSVAGWAKQGDVFNIAGVNRVHPSTKEDTGVLQQFVVKADASSDGAGNVTLSISPPIIITGGQQNVTAAPADNAPITFLTGASGASHQQGMMFHKNAITLATGKLKVPRGFEGHVETHKGIAVRVYYWSDGSNDVESMRVDVFYGIKVQNPDLGGRITS